MIPDPLLRRLRRLMLRARRTARGKLAGAYTAAVRGAGLMYADVRPYEPGDDIRRFDWNVTARTGVPHVKQYVAERERLVHLLVDVSGSMDFGFSANKRAVACEVAALIAYAAAANRDRIGLVLFTDRVELRVPPKQGERSAHRIVRELFHFQPAGLNTNLERALATLRRGRRSVVFLVSDFRDGGDMRALRIAARQHEVIAIYVSDLAESVLPSLGRVRLGDAEGGGAFVVNTSDRRVRSAYAAAGRMRREATVRELRLSGADVVEVNTSGGHLEALIRSFQARERRP